MGEDENAPFDKDPISAWLDHAKRALRKTKADHLGRKLKTAGVMVEDLSRYPILEWTPFAGLGNFGLGYFLDPASDSSCPCCCRSYWVYDKQGSSGQDRHR
ncbi:hypothetical protein [Paracoccus benzoatiresistens]|uniref:Uncharacterized protein n=1 Tax=Paracoccus benzoatiresistens TaxID=2997341 RepID=A0ABT4JB44_9RHOB|nr:hypothetical protein [Paracoccus sp. EF6]MCZ0964304.1 hypothetical protein [Paracoccus sp. EF6]